MPSKSKKQHKFMAAVANNPKFAKETGVPQSVGREYMKADEGRFAGGGMTRKEVPEDNPGLAKLPEPVRNKMGFRASGGAIKKMKNGGMAKCPRDGIAQRGRTRA
jgi:hypothetical protein